MLQTNFLSFRGQNLTMSRHMTLRWCVWGQGSTSNFHMDLARLQNVLVGEPKSRIMQKQFILHPSVIRAEFLYMEFLDIG